MRAVRLLSIVLAGLLGLALLAAWQVPGRLDWNRYRETIEALASARLGRPVTIAGPITLSLLPETELTAADVVVAAGTSPGASLGASGDGPAGPALTVKALRLRVAPLPLLSGRVDARELALSGADLTVEWPLRRGELAGWPPYWLSAFSARIEKSRLRIGGLTLDNIDATLETTDTGGLVAVGIGRVGGAGGQPIRLTARMTATGIDGAAGLNLAVEATDRSPGASAPGATGGVAGGLVAGFAGQLAGDGGLAGRIDLSGSDLSQLVAAPAGSVPGGSVPGGGFKAGAAVKAAGDLASFDDLTIDVDGPNGPSALRGAATLRLAPDLRLEAKLSAARLELDPFMSLLARMGGPGLTIGLQLQAEAVAFGGGLMRELSAALEVTPAQITLHEVAVRLPGEADLRLAGVVQRGDPTRPRFEGDVRLAAPRLREMLRWLDGAGLRLLPDLPDAVLTSTDFRAHAVVEPGLLALDRLDGQLDGTAVTGELRLWPRVAKPAGVPAGVGGNGAAGASGNRPAIVASLELGNLQLDPWLPDLWPNFGDGVLGFDVDLRLRAPSARLRGEEITALSLDAAVHSSVQGASAPIASGPIASGQLPQAPVALAQGAGVQGGGQGGAPPLASLGRVTLRQLEATLRGVRLIASGTVGEGGRLTEGKLQASTDDASALAGLLAPEWRPAAGFWRGPAALSAQLAGPAEALGLKLALDMANARLEAQPVIDLRSGKWAGPVTLRHPGAPRLLGLLGLPRAEAWLGEGSLSVIAQLSGGQLSGGQLSGGQLSVGQLSGGQASAGEGSGSGALGSGALGSGGRFSAELRDVTAGLLRLSASLALDASGEVPLLTGRIQADTLALPEPAWRDATPLPFALLRGWRASVPITARQVLVEREPRLMQAAGMISLGDGVLRLDPFGAVLAGGALSFTLVANAAMDPPVLAVSATLADATLDVPPDAAAEAPSGAREPGGLPLDLLAGRANLGLELSADGHSPAAMLATLSGGITLNVERGALSGFDLARVMRTVASADPRTRPATETALREAMVEGVTNFDRLEIRAEARSGTLVLQEGALTGSAGTAEFSGSVGLGARVLDLRVALRPAIEAPPEIAVRLTGPWAKPRRSPELAGFLRWLADRNSPTP